MSYLSRIARELEREERIRRIAARLDSYYAPYMGYDDYDDWADDYDYWRNDNASPGLFQRARNWAGRTLGSIRSGIGGAWNAVRRGVGRAFRTARVLGTRKLGQAWRGIRNFARGAWNTARNWGGRALGAIGGALNRARYAVSNWGRRAWQGLTGRPPRRTIRGRRLLPSAT